jgi:hypothetical protein
MDGVRYVRRRQKKVCAQCHKLRPLDDFEPDDTEPYGHRSVCNDCLLVRQTRLRRFHGMTGD